MPNDITNAKNDLERLPTSIFITKWIIDSVPYVFRNNYQNYIIWRHSLAKKLKIDPSDIIITGSACLGFSLNPNKNFRNFGDNSDIDVSIISEYYFNIGWHDLVALSDLSRVNQKIIASIQDHRNRLIYWGTLATDRILPILSFGYEWNNIIVTMNKMDELNGKEIKFRIYKDSKSLRDYLAISVQKRKSFILEAKANERLS